METWRGRYIYEDFNPISYKRILDAWIADPDNEGELVPKDLQYLANKEKMSWSEQIPKEVGFYWFYGDPFHGEMGQNYFDDSPPIETKMYLVEIFKVSNGLMATTVGQIIKLRKFSKINKQPGVVGYWQPAGLPVPPSGVLNDT